MARAGPHWPVPSGPPGTHLTGVPVLDTALAQLRFATSIIFGRPFASWSLEHLIDAMRETQRELGGIGAEGAGLIAGPMLDDETRRDIQVRRFRGQAVRGARETAYYRQRFLDLGLDPARLGYDDIARI